MISVRPLIIPALPALCSPQHCGASWFA